MAGGLSCNNERGNASFEESTKRDQKHEEELAGRERDARTQIPNDVTF